ncbi:hypothetical protein ACDQ55_20395 [Chitinophaga sp. 30R24]|uniref:hypothetical protein n=1 Tax=Chitinophaga sp. 30R24 TaxID=3248838 RepID=UPI003B908324
MREKLTSLLIDPDRDRRNQFYLALDLLSISKACISQDNISNALDYLKKNPDFKPDYIFLDSLQPADEASSFLKEIRKMKRLKLVPLIWYAASWEPEHMQAIHESGFAAGLAKQDSLHALKEHLSALLQNELAENEHVVLDEVSATARFKLKVKEVLLQTQSLLEVPEKLLTHS